MSTKETNQPQSPEELAKAAQKAAIKAVMEQNQALFGNMPGYQMPDMQAMQEQIMAQMKMAVPNLDEIQERQAQQLAAAGIDTDMLSQAFSQNMAYVREMMTGGEEAGTDSWLDLTDDEWEINRAETSELTEEQLRLLALGAPILVYNGERVNTIACESELETVRNTLESWWDVTDHDSTFHIAKWLLDEGYHADADNLLQSLGSEGLKHLLANGAEDENETAEEVRLIMLTMLENEYCTEENLPKSALAWDLVRMVNLARWSHLCDYISEEEMWQIMQAASDAAHEHFASWEEYGLSFIFGRGVWHGNPEDSETASEIVSVLLEKDGSPWKQSTWE